jgi:Leucine-rich repeat (LRR) protein
MKKYFCFITAILFICFKSVGQTELMDSVSLVLYPEYTDLSEALNNPSAVIKLSLKKKKLKEFPMDVLSLKNLQYLDLSKNRIKELPDSIVSLKQLQFLIISKTGLERLPKNIGSLKNLRVLNVNQNEISVLPYSIGQLENLEVADLWSNNLDEFPETMTNLKHLKVMDLRNILIPQKHQDRIQAMLPGTLIYFSPACNCSW